MAAAYERMGGGFYGFFYSDNQTGTTLCAFDPFGCGYAAFEDGKPRLTSRKPGGTYCTEGGQIQQSWGNTRGGPKIEFALTSHIAFTYKNRQQITVQLSCQGMVEKYDLGEIPQMAGESYLSKSVGVIKHGPERGKQILDVDKCRDAAQANRERRQANAMKELATAKKSNITEEDMQKHPELREVVASTDALVSTVRNGDWHVDVFVSKLKMTDTLGDSLPSLRMDQSKLRGNAHSQTLTGMAATDPDTLSQLLQKSTFPSRALPLSNAIKSASGRYRPEHGTHYKTARRRLKEIKTKDYDAYIKHEAPKNTIVVVCCLASWLPQARRIEPVLEQLAGELHAAAGSGGPKFELCKFEMSESRMLRDRYNITTLPMFLMYYNGQLAYASPTLNGYGTRKEDMVAQAATTLQDAQRGAFLAEGFKFS